jgi:transposase
MKNTGHRWTEEEMRTLIGKWLAGESIADIAQHFNTSVSAISKMTVRIRREGVPLPRRLQGHKPGRHNAPWTQEEVEFLVRRRNEGITAEVIGTELKRSMYSINGMMQVLRKEGVTVPMLGQGMRRLWSAEKLKISVVGRDVVESIPSLRLVK